MIVLMGLFTADYGPTELEALLESIAQGDQDALAALYDHARGAVYGLALSYLKNGHDADDVTQNVMLRAFRSAPELAGEEHARRWLIRVTVNESRRLLTAPWRRRAVPFEELEAILPAPDQSEQGELLSCVLSLPPKYRLPLYLYYYEGCSVEEVGRLIGRKPSTVQTQLARGRERLKKLLQEEGYHG